MTMTFEGAAKSLQFDELMAHEPSVAGHHFWNTLGIAFGVAITAGCLYAAIFLENYASLIGGIAAGVMALFTFFSIRSHVEFTNAPLERVLAQVKDETVETHVSTTHDRRTNRSRTRISHSYHLLLEFEDGERESHEVDEETSRMVAMGDIGVAFLKGGVLLDFQAITR